MTGTGVEAALAVLRRGVLRYRIAGHEWLRARGRDSQQPPLGQVRLIAVSGYGREEDRRRAETTGSMRV